MITLHAEASALTVTAGLDDTMLVAGMANVASVRVTFSEDWTGLGKTLLFYNGDKTILHIMESDDEIVPIPHEVLATPGRTLYVGVQGTDGEQVILPTVRCKLKAVLASIDPDGDRETIPDKPHWKEVKDTLEELAEDAETSADRAEQAAQNAGYMYFEIADNGHVIYTRTENTNVDFDIVNGRLLVYA